MNDPFPTQIGVPPALAPYRRTPYYGDRYHAQSGGFRHFAVIVLIFGAAILTVLADDWIAFLALVTLWLGWRYLPREPGAPIAAAAFTYQWMQVTIAIFYAAITGREIMDMRLVDYRPMILVGLASVVAMFGGYLIGAGFYRRRRPAVPRVVVQMPVSLAQIVVCYAASVALTGTLLHFAWNTPKLTQVILVLSLARYGLLFILVTRLLGPPPRWGWIALIALMEVALGFGGFFADFRQPLVIIAIAVMGKLDLRRPRTWAAIGAISISAVTAGIAWTGIKPVIRIGFEESTSTVDRIVRAASTAKVVLGDDPQAWQRETDGFVSRLWQVKYPAMALARVPAVLPHENGAILWSVLVHIFTPRFLFPEKGELPSDSEKVRKYAGIWVAGRETGTSYAFGYAAESYVDFGIPLMFFPIFFYGLLMGVARRHLVRLIRHSELRDGAIAIIFWSSLYLFETSWVMMVGQAITQLVTIGGGAVLIDHALSRKRVKRSRAQPAVFAATRQV